MASPHIFRKASLAGLFCARQGGVPCGENFEWARLAGFVNKGRRRFRWRFYFHHPSDLLPIYGGDTMKIRSSAIALLCAGFIAPALTLTPAQAWDRGDVDLFAVLPNGATGPEGLTVGSDGNVYVTTFGFNAAGPVTGAGQLYVFDNDGHLLRQKTVAGSSSHLLGIDDARAAGHRLRRRQGAQGRSA